MSIFTKQDFVKLMNAALAVIEKEHKNLSKLDAATGDGDHGVTILRTMKAIAKTSTEKIDLPLGELTNEIAMQAMMCDGGSTSPLLGSYFMGFANAAPADELDAEQTAAFFEAALANFYDFGKAEVGDKTMMDAMRPATETLAKELRANGNLKEAFAAAADSATAGAIKTKEFVAKFGRARTMGERAIGHQDPGATSWMHIFQAFADTI